MSDDTPELGRLVVLHGAVLKQLLTLIDEDAGLLAVLKEIDALTLRVAHRSRSAIDYHKTIRGEAALSDAEQVIVALDAAEEAGEPPPQSVELEHWVWSLEQLTGPIMPGMKPERRVLSRQFVGGMKFLSFSNR